MIAESSGDDTEYADKNSVNVSRSLLTSVHWHLYHMWGHVSHAGTCFTCGDMFHAWGHVSHARMCFTCHLHFILTFVVNIAI